MPMISYAQNREDVLLHRAFPHADGFYIDIGAADPVEMSVTKWFSDRGWAGVNVEPQPGYHAALCAARPRDVTLAVVVAAAPGDRTFYEFPALPGWSTLDPALADRLRADGREVVARTVPAVTLAELCDRHAAGPVDFLKIDVEGAERDVLAGADFGRHRPRVVVVEATAVGKPAASHAAWEPLLLAADYLFAFFDGLNRYYVRAEDAALVPVLAVPTNPFDDYVPYDLVSRAEHAEATAADRLRLLRERDADVAGLRVEVAALRAELAGSWRWPGRGIKTPPAGSVH